MTNNDNNINDNNNNNNINYQHTQPATHENTINWSCLLLIVRVVVCCWLSLLLFVVDCHCYCLFCLSVLLCVVDCHCYCLLLIVIVVTVSVIVAANTNRHNVNTLEAQHMCLPMSPNSIKATITPTPDHCCCWWWWWWWRCCCCCCCGCCCCCCFVVDAGETQHYRWWRQHAQQPPHVIPK